MAIKSVRVKINNVWVNLAYNSNTGKYEGIMTAPSVTSYNLAGKYYPVTVEASNDAGTITLKDDTDAVIGGSLRLVVKETIKPYITLLSPTDNAYVQNNKTTISFKVIDESSGSGVKENSIGLKLDGLSVPITKSSIVNGYQCSYTPSTALSDGMHTMIIVAQDNDGNVATAVNSRFTVDTVPPTLNVTSPTKTITNQPSCIVGGITNDATSSPVKIEIFHNGNDAIIATVDSFGKFSEVFALVEGENTFKVVSTDAAGRSTTVTRTIELDTTIPQVRNVRLSPNPTSTSQPVNISLEVV